MEKKLETLLQHILKRNRRRYCQRMGSSKLVIFSVKPTEEISTYVQNKQKKISRNRRHLQTCFVQKPSIWGIHEPSCYLHRRSINLWRYHPTSHATSSWHNDLDGLHSRQKRNWRFQEENAVWSSNRLGSLTMLKSVLLRLIMIIPNRFLSIYPVTYNFSNLFSNEKNCRTWKRNDRRATRWISALKM